MANYSELLNDINAAIYENNDQEIDALEVRAILREMVTSLGSGYLFKGIATPSSPSGTGTYEPDQNVFYLATTAGTYTYLGGLVVAAGEVAFLCYDGTWTKKSSALLSTGSIVDNTTTEDATKPLSAKQGKALADAGAATAAEVTALGQYVLNNYLTGAGQTYVSNQFYGLIPGRTYRVFLKNQNWDITGITGDTNYKFLIRNDYNGSYTILVGKRLPDTISAYYDITIPTNSDYITIGGRAASGVKIEFFIEDITDIQRIDADLWGKFAHTNLDITATDNGYYQLDRTIKSGTPCKVKIDFSNWNIYTNIIAYTTGGGTHETIKGAVYTNKEEIDYTPTIDVNYIRIDSAHPGAGKSADIKVRSAVEYVDTIEFGELAAEVEEIRLEGSEQTFDGQSGWVALGYTLLKGHTYQVDYDVTDYNHLFYSASFYSATNGGSNVGTIVSAAGYSAIKGRAIVTLTGDAKSVRITIGNGTPPAEANVHLSIYEVRQIADTFYVDEKVDEVKNQWIPILASYFEQEMQDTIDTLNTLTDQRCLVLPILTDNHWRWTTAQGNAVNNRCQDNVRYLCERVYCDGVAHLGDILDTGQIGDTPDSELYDLMQQYLMRLSGANKNFYSANGNHDGAGGSTFNELKWYGIIGRATANDLQVVRYEETPYFYFDHKPTKVRCIFLANPDQVTGGSTYWGFSPRELDWLENTALDVPDGYNVLFFTHIPPISGFADSAANLADFVSLVEDFNANNTGEVLGVICGHQHVDLVCDPGWTYTGGLSNTLPCPVILLGATYYNLGTSTVDPSTWGGIRYGRMPETATEDLWTILVYTPDDAVNKMHFVRFGAGADFDV